ncbi:HD domain-containing protein [Weissella diestrammenae]|uniref:HD domain-containing protein n=1 Tax=Weissella diestrammenae TaxID=1162633 RepID=A0A7G9T6M5_9LACO|nr:HD domain-containing protein [Weissella diestrammenae]MCM0582966.1 HD domain-containing protein [Weissella diestrammenae]QNN75750.1 HD domain-containing protein [Weissella diestrammenae]
MQEKVFRDPVHNFIRIDDPMILALIDTREFQRLRRIKQLGVANTVFHTAEHSRFTHSLGVYEIARQFAAHLINFKTQTPGDGGWQPEERRVLLAAALLHDLGHGPYSHTFEHIFKTDHEKYTQQIILSSETEVNQVLRTVSDDFPSQVASVIAKTYPNPQVVSLISSQIDADRMDYLLRDAYYTGATYGMFDLFRIIHLMRPYVGGIAFEDKGMTTVEDYVVSRYQMYGQVYFHPVSRGMEVLLTHLLERAMSLYERSKTDSFVDGHFVSEALVPLFEHQISITEYLALDDATIIANISNWRNAPDRILADLATRFLDRKPLKSIEIADDVRDLLPKLVELIQAAGFDERYYTAENDSFDTAYDSYNPNSKKTKTPIEVIQQDGTLVELSSESTLVQALRGRTYGNARFFFPNEMLSKHADWDLMAPMYEEFQHYVRNGKLIRP